MATPIKPLAAQAVIVVGTPQRNRAAIDQLNAQIGCLQ
jgi:hypothetical protein